MKKNRTIRAKINTMYRIATVFFLLIISTATYGQSNHKNLREGDRNYYQKNYLDAEEDYRKALQKDEKSVNANHNLGNSLYNQERYEEAAKYFESAALEATSDTEKAMSYHNLGNSYLSQMSGITNPEKGQDVLQKSVEAYKQGLKHNPKDDATRYNLAYAQKLYQQFLQEQQKQQQQEQQQQQQNESQDNQSSSDEGENQQNKDNQQPTPNPSKGENMTKEEAERLIKIMEEEERKVQEKMNKKKQRPNPKGKDW